jgi:peptide/nickel transport system substrate-binding protein
MNATLARLTGRTSGSMVDVLKRLAIFGIIPVVLLASACTSSGAPTTAASGVLNIGHTSPPNSMDPAKINAAFNWYVDLAYDPLIYRAPDGKLEPRLAESWKYVGSGNTVFEIKLRPNVMFSDGSPLTAEVVKANIAYFQAAAGQAAAYLAPVKSVDVVDPLTVRLTLSEASPLLPTIFTQDYLAGDLISGPGLAKPDGLASNTFGAGPYTLDAAQTVANDHYTYIPNPNYWDKPSVRYTKVTIKVLPNPNTALSALRTGQVDVIQGDYTTAGAAKSAGLSVTFTPQVFQGLALADRAGELVPALKDVRVRQALNYGVDRQKIAKALFGEYGTVTEQIVLPGQDGYNESARYNYDPAKAKSLLEQAGYGSGFTIKVLTTSFANTHLVPQAMAEDLEKIGVKLELTNQAEAGNYIRDLGSGEFPAYGIGYGTQPVHLMGPGLFLPSAALFNPRKSSDPEIEMLYQKAAQMDDAGRAAVDRQIIARLTDQAWFVPVVFVPVFFFANEKVADIEPTTGEPIPNPVHWRPAA